jgi:tetratricopeptide (TPR) repeat protein
MESKNWYTKIDDYLDGVLDVKEKEEMNMAIRQDVDLAREVRLSRMEREAMNVLLAEKARADFMSWTESIAEEVSEPVVLSVKWRKVRWWYISSAAAVFLLCIFFIWYSKSENKAGEIVNVPPIEQIPIITPIEQSPQTKDQRTKPIVTKTQNNTKTPISVQDQPLIATVYEQEALSMFKNPDEPVFRGQDNQTETQKILSLGYIIYNNAKTQSDYKKTLEILEQITPDQNEYLKATYLKGFALFKMRQYDDAADKFAIVYNADQPYSKSARWLEALSLYAAGGKQKERLKAALEEIISKKFTSDEQKKANEWLAKLK